MEFIGVAYLIHVPFCRFLINNKIFQGKVINVNPSGSINVEINGRGIKEYESNRIKILL